MPGLDSTQPSRMKTAPIQVPRTTRTQMHRVLTSFQPGYANPVLAIPLLREDSARIDIRLQFEQMETVELLVNAVNARALAYVVPFSAFDRYDGMDSFNRSYMKKPKNDDSGATVVPFINTIPFVSANANILKKMGVHARENQPINSAYIEAYNEIFNFRCRNRSPDLYDSAKRTALDQTLAPAFWNHQLWAGVVPDFDQASIEGEVPLTVTNSVMPVYGIGNIGTTQAPSDVAYRDSSGAVVNVQGWNVASVKDTGLVAEQTMIAIQAATDPTSAAAGFPHIWAELQQNGITVSLANIEMARRTQAFALLRRQFNGLEDDYIMDLLMSGITVPDQDLRQPILLADRSTVFGMAKRYSTTSDDLTASVTNGGTFLDLRLRVPKLHTGGIIMVIVEVVPEQLFERQADPYLTTLDQDLYPEFIRDTLDPEKVDVVHCEDVDVHHTTPNTTFGYTYLNEKWARSRSRIGGKFWRPSPDGAFDEDRQRLWAVETLNPTLTKDFYLCGTVNRKPFLDTVSDAYECTVLGTSQIQGNTVFGRPLIEASDDYQEILEQAPDNPTIPKSVVTGAESAAEAGVANDQARAPGRTEGDK